MKNTDLNNINYWFPKLKAAGIPVPETEIIECDNEKILMWIYGEGERPDKLISDIIAAGDRIGWPIFLRSGYTSAKHSWEDACFVSKPDDVERHLFAIGEFSQMCSFLGLPVGTWAVRKLLPTIPAFTAFSGMPITREWRIFVRDGSVEHIQPYWPPDAIEGHTDAENWASKLRDLNQFRSEEEKAKVLSLALCVSAVIPGFWSVDILETEIGWFVTDMAVGEESFRWEPEVQP